MLNKINDFREIRDLDTLLDESVPCPWNSFSQEELQEIATWVFDETSKPRPKISVKSLSVLSEAEIPF